MQRSLHSASRWLIFAPVAVLAWVAPASADAVTGLAVTGYTVDQTPPIKSDAEYPVCGQGTLDFINAVWDTPDQQFGDCGTDLFMLHYTGSIQIPEHQTIEFWLASDDGGTVQIGSQMIGRWSDSGCAISYEGEIDISAGTHPIDAWFYETGGYTCFMLAWNIDGAGWSIVPPEAFTSEPTPDTTVPDTTLPDTTVPDTTTSSTTTSTTVYVTTSQIPVTTSTSTTTTSTTTTTTAAPVPTQTSSTTTEPPAVPSTTTTETPVETTTTVPETTTSTTITIETSTTWPPITAPETTVPVISTTSTTAPSTTAVATTTTLDVIDSTVPAVETTVTTSPVTQTTVDLVLELSELSAAVDALISVLPDQITVADITEITDSQAFGLLSDEQITEIAEIISAAPDEVKQAFESAVDVFADDALSEYVPAGSTISVAERRAVIAVTALTFVLPLPIPTQGRSHDQSRRQR